MIAGSSLQHAVIGIEWFSFVSSRSGQVSGIDETSFEEPDLILCVKCTLHQYLIFSGSINVQG